MILSLQLSKVALISLIIVIFLSGCADEELQVREDILEARQYLKENSQEINLAQDISFAEFEEDIKNYDLFLTGEDHGVAVNKEVAFWFLKYLNQKVGIKYYLGELGYSRAYFINQYLSTGDENYLNICFKTSQGGNSYTEEYYSFWQNIYNYNQTLAVEDRIEVVGIDATIYGAFLIPLHMKDILPETKEVPSQLEEAINDIDSFSNWILEKANEGTLLEVGQDDVHDFFISSRWEVIKTDKNNVVSGYLGAEVYNEFLKLIEDGEEAIAVDAADNFWQKREETMMNNFAEIYPQLKPGKFYGQWGSGHILRKHAQEYSDINLDRFIGEYIDTEIEGLEGKVFSIYFIYEDCYSHKRGSVSDKDEVLRYYKDFSDPIVLCRLLGTGSPFADEFYLDEIFNNTSGGPTIDYFQSVLYLKGFGESTDLGELPAVYLD